MDENAGSSSELSSISGSDRGSEHDHYGSGDEDNDHDVDRSENLFSDADEDGGGSSESEGEDEEDADAQDACEWGDICNHSPLQVPDYPEDEELLVRPDSTHPKDLMRLFLTDEVIHLIVRETNRYVEQQIAQEIHGQHARINRWENVTAEEIVKFIGVLIVMGLNQQPSFKDYWSKSSKIYGSEIIRKAMSRDRFQLILSSLHFADNETANTDDPIYKIRGLFDVLNLRFKEVLRPSAKLVVDESMRKWRGRLRFRVYNPHKSNKYGIKLFKLTTVGSYVLSFKVYCGAEDAGELVPSQQVILDLCEPYLDEGRTVFADNFYSGLPLVETLANRSTLYCGTVRQNRRDLPPSVVTAKLKKGEAIGQQCQHGTKVINWRDKRNVYMISTIHDHDAELQPPAAGQTTSKPQSVLDYNYAKKGIDVNDQMGSYHDINRKGIKWYRKLALDILCNTLVVNAWVIQRHVVPRPMGIVKFREQIALSFILGDHPEPAVVPRKRKHTLRLGEGTLRSNGKRCKRCYKGGRQGGGSRAVTSCNTKKVLTFCDSCPLQPPMCLPCFNASHR